MDIFGNDPTKKSFDPNPNGVTEGDVVEIPHKSTSRRKKTGFARKIEGAHAWVESDTKTVTGWYALVALKPTRTQ